MRISVWLGFLVTSFSLSTACGGGGEGDKPDAMPVALTLTCDTRYTSLCANLDTALERSFLVDGEINTDTSMDCAKFPFVAVDSPYCLILGSNINVAAGVTLRAVGSRPLVLLASGNISVDGTIDVSSRRATRDAVPVAESIGAAGNHSMCSAFRRQVDSSVDGGAGGAGGTFGGTGGGGGDGNYDIIPARAQGGLAPLEPDMFPEAALRGGCRAQNGGNAGPTATNGGRGGPGGGIVVLMAKLGIVVNGAIAANGGGGMGGGAQAGGGGGGSGGLIILQGATVRRAGKLTANGGGGGEGGAIDIGEVIGADGSDGGINASPATGGNSNLPPSRGGDGGARGAPGGDAGTFSNDAGAGGGGAVGFIRVIGLTSAAGTALESPAATFVTN
jgi:hypothetical protein